MTQKSRSRVAPFPVFFAQSAIALRKNGWADNHVVGPCARRMHTTKHNTHSRHNTSGVCLCRELVDQRTFFVVSVQCSLTKKRKEKGGYVCLAGGQIPASLFSCSVNQNNKNKSARAAELTAAECRAKQGTKTRTKKDTQDSRLKFYFKFSFKFLLSSCAPFTSPMASNLNYNLQKGKHNALSLLP